jgi:hypothetical protein
MEIKCGAHYIQKNTISVICGAHYIQMQHYLGNLEIVCFDFQNQYTMFEFE